VNFAELEKFIDTPVKRYSSGMYVRLAFAVAAHLEPEILIVDEVLAVGDAEFQKKCIGKMGDVSREGRTVLLVSHNMTTIQALAGKAIYLDSGFTQGVITVSDAVRQYIYGNEQSVLSCFRAVNPSSSRKNADIVEARVINKKGDTVQEVETCEPLLIEIKLINRSGVPVNPNFVLVNHSGVAVMSAIDTPIDWTGSKKSEPGAYTSRAKIPPHLLSADDYFVHLALDSSTPRVCHDVHPNALRFTLIDPIDERCIARGDYKTPFNTVLLPALEWTWEYERDNKELSGLIK
jgi:lipopolysaccharide transport system ATP-binding protein